MGLKCGTESRSIIDESLIEVVSMKVAGNSRPLFFLDFRPIVCFYEIR